MVLTSRKAYCNHTPRMAINSILIDLKYKFLNFQILCKNSTYLPAWSYAHVSDFPSAFVW